MEERSACSIVSITKGEATVTEVSKKGGGNAGSGQRPVSDLAFGLCILFWNRLNIALQLTDSYQ